MNYRKQVYTPKTTMTVELVDRELLETYGQPREPIYKTFHRVIREKTEEDAFKWENIARKWMKKYSELEDKLKNQYQMVLE